MKGTSLPHLLMEREHTSIGARTAEKGKGRQKRKQEPGDGRG